jgi:hypothetical protein
VSNFMTGLDELLQLVQGHIHAGGRAGRAATTAVGQFYNPHHASKLEHKLWQFGFDNLIAHFDTREFARLMKLPARCSSFSSDSMQCELDAGHTNPHYATICRGGGVGGRYWRSDTPMELRFCQSVSKEGATCGQLQGHGGEHEKFVFYRGQHRHLYWTDETAMAPWDVARRDLLLRRSALVDYGVSG